MDSTAQSRLDEFVRNMRAPVQQEDNFLTWQEEPFRFIVEPQETHLIISIEQTALEADSERQLLELYRRAAPQRFMGLPVRIYQQNASMTGTLALPWDAVETEHLLKLCDALRHLFESASLNTTD
ncbi:Putative Type III secretion system apparatus protein, ssaM [Candidatus Glomeribacter gigasporarum BEG34]|uniref:Putative Type III secretion system apparatus protein, ssaM n=1 Tax=Candidatus Glomeribacter gigasporarum BEG34 TaxID=1070319 RepID=G2J8Y2_9BURK|nr:hypothetical protein [Candidatus Glomeribacter gigasporarum]CCD29229.1 Putative Type III secretion system apparatus protein, ssaM [Candidatus Glomeribacter gigasporarum BEG34]